ncbi:MAG TPA: hypothetical protein VHX44_08115 [Planctomycetota bacterium]|jgi:hypothetical protein|nr:hypothetical protein [Planctomycetota bacterium]
MSSATTWQVKKRTSRRRLSFTSPITVLLLPAKTTRAFRSPALEIQP